MTREQLLEFAAWSAREIENLQELVAKSELHLFSLLKK